MYQEKLQEKLVDLVSDLSEDTFVYELLTTYNFPKSTITILKNEPEKLSRLKNQIIVRNKLVFHRTINDEDIHAVIDRLQEVERINKLKPRFIIVTDFNTLLAVDTKTKETLDIPIGQLPKHYSFFLPWVGMEKVQHTNEKEADVKAASTMAKLYDQIIKDSPGYAEAHLHDLNQFLTRLLFCFFAEDAEIFPEGIFTGSVGSHTQADGSDMQKYFEQLFEVLNTDKTNRTSVSAHFEDFPYVNGGLFKDSITLPNFSKASRDIIVSSGNLDWSVINPDIFGSMIQAVTNPGMREDLGMHYTSVPNILKVIEPLFLNELYTELEKASSNVKKLQELHKRIVNIRVFDPACGSGNFLIIAYKELCKLELKIFEKVQEAGGAATAFSSIRLDSFYGIEIDDFAHEVAKLSLWLAQHQMNKYFSDMLGMLKPTLPLSESGHIVCGNATRLDWLQVCPKENSEEIEIFVIGNPPYEGSRKQKEKQKEDLKNLFVNDYKSLDYISAWFYKGAQYISKSENVHVAFVSTNSITQGEQISLLWPRVFAYGVEINFAHKSFKWKNLAKANAGVAVVIVGLGASSNRRKLLYSEHLVQEVDMISPYLESKNSITIKKRSVAISNLPEMTYGNMPLENNFLKLDDLERKALLEKYPSTAKYIRPLVGGTEFLKSINRYCLWIEDSDLKEVEGIPDIKKRIENVRLFRKNGGEVGRSLVGRSHQFRYRHEAKKHSIVVPCTSSENRMYLPCGVISKEYITLNSVQVIYDSDIFVFGLLSSRMHILWTKAVGGKLENRIRYSSALCYNTFPFPNINNEQRDLIREYAFNVLEEREKYPDKTPSEMYDPEAMPLGLKKAHEFLDEVIERIYQKKPFEGDEERLACLFEHYEKMIEEEKQK